MRSDADEESLGSLGRGPIGDGLARVCGRDTAAAVPHARAPVHGRQGADVSLSGRAIGAARTADVAAPAPFAAGASDAGSGGLCRDHGAGGIVRAQPLGWLLGLLS